MKLPPSLEELNGSKKVCKLKNPCIVLRNHVELGSRGLSSL